MADLEVTASLKGEIADLLAKLKLAQEAIREFKRTASTKSDLNIAKDLQTELNRVAKLGKSGIIRDAVKQLEKDAEAEATKGGQSLASRFAQGFRDRLKKEKFTPPGWLPWLGAGLLAAPGAISGSLGVIGGFGTAAAGAAAGLGALAIAAKEVLGPVKQAFTTIDQLGVTNAVPANATALQTWLTGATKGGGLSGAARKLELARLASYRASLGAAGTPAQIAKYKELILSAQQKLGIGAPGSNTLGNLGFLANPNVNWYTLTPKQQRNLVLAAQSTTGMPASEKAQISALMQERQAYTKLNPAQQGALFQYTKFDQALTSAQNSAQPAVLGVFSGGLQTILPLLKYIKPLADAAYAGLMPLMNILSTGFKSPGFASFMKLLQGQATMAISGFGKAAINVGIGLGHIFSAIAKSGLSKMMVDDLVKMTGSFAHFTASKSFMSFVSEMKANAPTVVDILKQLFQILGKLIQSMGGGLSTAALKFLDLLLKGLNKLAGIPGIGPMIYNLTAFVLLFSKFGTLKAVGAIFDMIYTGLGKIIALKVGTFVAGLLGLETKGMGLAKMWKTIGTAVWAYSKQQAAALLSSLKSAAAWTVGMLGRMGAAVAGWAAGWLGIDISTEVGSAAAIAASGGILLGIGLLVIGIYELVKHWKTVWATIKQLAKDAWDFIVNGWGKYLLPFLGPVGLLVLGIIEVWKHWKTIWNFITTAVGDAYKFLKITFLNILIQAAGWAKGMVHLAADAFGWIPGLGPKLKGADKAIGDFISSTKASLASLTHKQYSLTFGVDLPPGVSGGSSFKNRRKFASGTSAAPAGWAWVGEAGPELMHMSGGETVLPHGQSMHVTRGFASGTGVMTVHLSLPSIRAVSNMLSGAVGKIVRYERSHATLMAGAGGSSLVGGPTSASALQAQAYARSRLSAYGWGQDQMLPLIALWNQESGWDRFAYNPSGATGIPQSLPYTKMPRPAWLPWQGGQADAGAQINWGLGYIASTYGSPAGAEAHELSNHWYGYGGTIPYGHSGIVGDRGIEAVTVGPHGATVTPLSSGSKPPFLLQVFTNEINPRYHAAQLGWELARRAG